MKNVFFLILLFFVSIFYEHSLAQQSVMAVGNWHKISINRDGIYRITYSELVSLGIDDPSNVRIYGSGGAMLPERANKNLADDLQEIPVWMHTNDGTFKAGDYIVFYGQGPAVWSYNKENQAFEHQIHLWDRYTYYYITSKAGGKRITTDTSPTSSITQTVTSFDERLFHEEEKINLQNSGRYWYGEDFFDNQNLRQRFNLTVPDVVTNAPAWLNIAFMGRTSSSAAQLHVSYNNNLIAQHPLPVNISGNEATETIFNTSTFNPVSNNMTFELIFNRNGVAFSGGRLDYIRLFARRWLNMSGTQMFFRDINSVGSQQTARFQITGSNSNIHVWDITDLHNIKRMSTSLSGSTLSFSANTENLREFVAFNIATGLLRPNFPEHSRVENQNLLGIENVDMVIVTHPDFLEASHELAQLHRQRDQLAVAVVTDEQVYNEFSSGKTDPAAIRNFMKHVYEKQSTVKLKYLLLMGAGSYDNKSNTNTRDNSNFIVTYQSINSWNAIHSYVSDDYFGILGDDEPIETGMLAIGIGRLPVRTVEQAEDVVAKMRRYMDTVHSGDWQNFIGLLAEDGDKNLHTGDSDKLAEYMNDNHPQYLVEKLYMAAFPRTATVDGHRYLELENKLMSLINSGCLLINYIGHGNSTGLSSGRIINNTSISHWQNKLLPIFVAATCDFGRFDNISVSGSENLVLKANGGCIAVVSSSRLVYSPMNFDFNENFFKELFTNNQYEHQRLGDVMRRAKNATRNNTEQESINKLCFALLGNPALKPLIPTNLVQTVSINGKYISEPLDALNANAFVTVRGTITDINGSKIDNFDGILHFSLFDKPHEHQTINNGADGTPFDFFSQTSTLFKGRTLVENGEFEISFRMPRNINYKFGFGKMTYFAVSDDGTTAAAGAFNITVGGSTHGIEYEGGPQISLFMNDTYFRDGGVTDQNPILLAFLEDQTGINTSDEGIGHNITAILNNNPSNVYVLNRHFEAELGYHNKGVVNYRFNNLPEGAYELWFTAWNLENNPSHKSIRFRVVNSSKLKIDNLYNYPNPFTDNTRIYFEFNMPDTQLEVELQIFDLSGRLLRTMKQSFISEGFTSGDFEWDRHDAHGNRVISGIYPYRVILTTDRGVTEQMSSKMVIY